MQAINPLKNLTGRPIILASNSPRRKELLQELGIQFEVKTAEINEDFPSHIPPKNVARFLAEKKASYFKENIKNEIIITADTIVLISDKILNKPVDESEAKNMLQELSGKKHEVISAVCVTTNLTSATFDDVTEVYFRELIPEELDFYISNYLPFDKAGSYGIQEWIGMIGIEMIRGSYFNVMGLPVHKLYTYLKEIK